MNFSNGRGKRVGAPTLSPPKPSRAGARRAELAGSPRGASKRPAATAGLLLLLSFSTQEGCRCQRGSHSKGGDPNQALAHEAWLGGNVVDRRDHPVPEARVLALRLLGDAGVTTVVGETATDLQGHFIFSRLPPGKFRL